MAIYLVLFLVTMAGYSWVGGIVVLPTYETSYQRRFDIVSASQIIAKNIVPLVTLTTLFAFIYTAGLLLLFLPALYASARYACLTPAILIEEKGWESWGRSITLSQNYRWPIMAVFLLSSLYSFVEVALVWDAPEIVYLGLEDVIDATLAAIPGSIIDFLYFTILLTLVYIRLLEIKQGFNEETIERVFD